MEKSEFYKLEYESLRQEIMASQSARDSYEKTGAALIAALYGWLTTKDANPDATLWALAWWIPPFIALGVAWRCKSLSQGIRKAGGYLVTVEQAILGADGDGPKGWHVKLAADREALSSKAGQGDASWYRRWVAKFKRRTMALMRFFTGQPKGVDSQMNSISLTWFVVALATFGIAIAASQ